MAKAEIVLITGGARSGKSAQALRLASARPGIFLATAEALDQEMKERIRQHRLERSAEWKTIEEPVLPARILTENHTDTVVVDCITLWLSNLLMRSYDQEQIEREVSVLCEALQAREATTILVTNEVGMGIVPEHASGRLFRDVAGKTNQRIAAMAHCVIFMVSGLPLYIK
ncbi:bifunctional adenosylcobinamide kinase/adenosylcobinamide-phosphate guanylyltransferase [bacterium]|nr:bifunctional adenosylcobinamide kinase/adenosylcobinamide-phosphate guanylyltransferase [bacterium]